MGTVNRTTEEIMHDLKSFYGENGLVSDWLVVSQELINTFAEATMDPDWMHIDPDRAKRDGPFDGTIAFGFWTMSMLTHFSRQMTGQEYPDGVKYGFNYGFDRVRLMTPIPVGSRIRNRMTLLDVEDKGDGRFLMKSENTVEIEGEEKPAMVAVWLGMLVTGDEDPA